MRNPSGRIGAHAILILLVVAGMAACKSAGTSASDGAANQRRRNTAVMDTTELRGGNYSSVYDAISARHADWLLPRGGPLSGRPPELGVWIEGSTRSMGVDYLRQLRPVDIRQVRRLSTTESLHTYSWPWGGLVLTLR